MISIYAQSTTGSQGVTTAVILTWWEDRFKLWDNVISFTEEVASSVGTSGWMSFRDQDVGDIILKNSTLEADFLAWLEANPLVGRIYSHGTTQQAQIFRQSVRTDLGQALKSSPWWATNLSEIEQVRKDLKIAQKVHSL